MNQNPTPVEITCPGCGARGAASGPHETGWRCPTCDRGYSLRRCAQCRSVSFVNAKLQPGAEWPCIWCNTANFGFAPRNDPATAPQAHLVSDIARQALQYHGPAGARAAGQAAPPVIDHTPVLIVTTNEIPGYRITSVQGDVFGLVVRARNYFANVGAQFMTLAGGEVSGYTKLLTDSRNQARQRMWAEARMRGANAVVAMRFDCNEIGQIMSEVAAYGTAVTVEPLQAAAGHAAEHPPTMIA